VLPLPIQIQLTPDVISSSMLIYPSSPTSPNRSGNKRTDDSFTGKYAFFAFHDSSLIGAQALRPYEIPSGATRQTRRYKTPAARQPYSPDGDCLTCL